MIKQPKYIELINLRNSIVALLCVINFFLGGFITREIDEEKIIVSMVREAQKITGLDFTGAEADSMLETLETGRKNYAQPRKPNSIVPFLNFC